MITSIVKGNKTTYKVKDYVLLFNNQKPSGLRGGFCSAKMTLKNKPILSFQYFYSENRARLEDLCIVDSTQIGTSSLAKELDLMMHLLEKHLKKQGLTFTSVNTHKGFAKFLLQRNWRISQKNNANYTLEKKLTQRNNPLPGIMRGKWRARKARVNNKIK
ncbi:MAG: hypothetical protein WC290_02430 [archaeon]|jgi:hypothetical protein